MGLVGLVWLEANGPALYQSVIGCELQGWGSLGKKDSTFFVKGQLGHGCPDLV